MVAIWMSSPSVNSLHTSGVSPAWDCTTRFRSLERYVLWNLLAFTTSPTFSSPPMNPCTFLLQNSSHHWTGFTTFPHSTPMPHSLRWNPISAFFLFFSFPILHWLMLHESTDLHRGQDIYSEGGTHRETQRPQSKAKVGTRDKETRSQLRQVVDS